MRPGHAWPHFLLSIFGAIPYSISVFCMTVFFTHCDGSRRTSMTFIAGLLEVVPPKRFYESL
jgi:hypothetical protein